MPNRSNEARPARQMKRWIIPGLILLGLALFLFEPIQTYFKVRSGVLEWREQIPFRKARSERDGPDVQERIPPGASLVPPTIDSDVTLSAAKSPWVMAADVTVERGCTLTVEPGTEVLLVAHATLFVFGSLRAEGTFSKPIGFHSLTPSNYWAGLFFGGGTAPSRLEYVEISNAQHGIRPLLAEVTLENCVTRNLREVCSAKRSDTVFKNCRFLYEDLVLTGNINVFKFLKGTVVMENCEIYCPETDLKIDAIDADHVERGIFRGNRIHGSTCEGADAIDIGEHSRNILIEGNLISDMVDKGISVGEGARVEITNNVIVRCGMGVGVKDGAHVLITHTTFVDNVIGVNCYEKTPGAGGGHAEVRQSVFASMSDAPLRADALSTLIVSDSLCDTMLLPGEGNIHATPSFENPDLDLFALVIDAAGDVDGGASALAADSLKMKDLGSHVRNPGKKR